MSTDARTPLIGATANGYHLVDGPTLGEELRAAKSQRAGKRLPPEDTGPPAPDVAGHVARLRARGFAVCKPDRAEKRPTYRGWGTCSKDPADFGPGDQVGILGGPLSDGGRPGHALVEIDLDANAAVERADDFLPPTAMMDGRQSKPKSHRYFLIPFDTIPKWAESTADQGAPAAAEQTGHPGPFKKQFRDAEGRCLIDFIGTGGQVVCPPSVHDSGERREWVGGDEPGEPAVVPFGALWDAVRDLAAACGAELPAEQRVELPAPPASPPRTGQRSDAEARAVAYLAKCPEAVAGQGGHGQTMWAARCVAWGFDLGAEAAYRLLAEYFNPRCRPPWSDRELWHKATEADKPPFDKPRGWLRDQPRPDAPRVRFGPAGVNGHAGGVVTAGAADDDQRRTDCGNARELVALHGEDLRYCHPWKGWLVWDGECRWAEDDTAEAERRAKGAVVAAYRAAADRVREITRRLDAADDDARKALQAELAREHRRLKWALASMDRKRIAAMLHLAGSESGVPVRPADLDADPWALNCPNGVVNLRDGSLRPARRADLMTKRCPTAYDPDAACPTWERVLAAAFAGDADMVRYVRRVLGYCLTGDVREQALFFLHGAGSNGKSLIINTVLAVVGGDYAMTAPAELLMVRIGEAHPTERADLFGRRLVAVSENQQGSRLNESLVKQLTGADPIRARRMRQDFFEFVPTHKLVLIGNHKPKIVGGDHAIWRRVRLIPFDVKFWNPDEPAAAGEARPPHLMQDKTLSARLAAESPGILAWLVAGCLDWQEHGLGAPPAVAKATAAYRAEQDLFGAFLEDRCIAGAGACRVKASELYQEFRKWCEAGGERTLPTHREFGLAMTARGIERKSSNGTWYVGVALREGEPA